MLTKTKKWFVIFALAFVALFLVACDEDKEQPVAPETIEIVVGYSAVSDENAVLVGGEKMPLSVEVTPANASKDVEWSSSDVKYAVVDGEGKVTGLVGGTVTITATSKVDSTKKAEVEVKVIESFDAEVVLDNALKYIKDRMPEWVTESFTFPVYPNQDVTVEYYNPDGLLYEDGEYPYEYVSDAEDFVRVKITYEGEERSSDLYFKVVESASDNDFLTRDHTKAQIEEYLGNYIAEGYKIYNDLALPKTLRELYEWKNEGYPFGEEEVTIAWTSSNKAVLSNTGEYTRPNNDTKFQLEAYMLVGDNSFVLRYNVVAKGYTADEKVQYLLDNFFNIPEEIQGANIFLPVTDNKFGVRFTWSSDNPTVLGANGRMDPYLEEEDVATLTVTISYDVEGTEFDFTQDVEFEVLVKPAVNDAQKVILDLSNQFDAETFPHYFPYGRVEGNKIPLPTKVPSGTYKDTAITWTAKEAGLIDENYVLQKQYLRFHEVLFTFTVKVGNDTASGEVPINVGIAESADEVVVGGRFANNATPDALYELSKDDFDFANTDPDKSFNPIYGPFDGFTFYVDYTDPETNVTTRYRYFGSKRYNVHITSDIVNVDENGEMTLKDPSKKLVNGNDEVHNNYQYVIFFNETDKTIRIPIVFLNYKGSPYTKDVNGTTLIRQVSQAFDGWRIGMAADKDGKVTYGFGTTSLEQAMDAAGEYVPYVEVPAGGFAWSPFTSQNKAFLGGPFCTVGNQLHVEWFDVKPLPEA